MSRVKKCLSVLVSIVMAFAALAGFGLTSEIQTHAEGDFGADAYAYMEYLSTNYPERIAGTDVLGEARNWLISTVQGFGYEVLAEYCEGTSPLGWGDYEGYNLTFTKTGASEKTIVVCAHYDCAWTTGADDNASGVGVLLETAKRIFNEELPYTVQFILFDIEEPGCVGSQYYVDHAAQEYLDSILCVINIDTVAAGDVMYAYGGDVDEQGNFTRTWALWQVIEIGQNLGIDITIHPDVNSDYPTPTKSDGSDQTAFNAVGIPYVYFEASNWNGGSCTNFYQTANSLVENGKIMHVAEYDNLTFINETFPGRVQEHLTAYSRLVYEILYQLKDPAESSAEETTAEETSSVEETATVEASVETEPETETEIETETESETELEIEVADPAETESDSEEETEITEEKTEITDEEIDSEIETTEEEPENEDTSGGLRKWIIVIVVLLLAAAVVSGVVFVRRRKD